jgi:arylamine N-acetyltransferase
MSDWVERYLRLLGLEREPPSLPALARLVRAQVLTVPFENVTAILRRARAGEGPVPPVDTDAMLDAWEARGGGGVCFDATPTFQRLLRELGYTLRPSTALISFPGSHQASVVEIDGAEYMVDAANGAPFLEPIPLDRETTLNAAGLSWRFRRESDDVFVQDRLIDGEWRPFCQYTLSPVDPAAQEAAYQRHQLAGETWVVGNLTLVRSTSDEVYRLRDDQLAHYSADGVRTETIAEEDLPRVAAEVFGLPALPVAAAYAALKEIRAARV